MNWHPRSLFGIVLATSWSFVSMAQSTTWRLEDCIQHARANNLQVREAELNTRMNAITEQQVKFGQLPSLNADASLGESYGRSIDPTSNQFVTQGFMYNSLGVSSQALLFGWFQKKYQREQSRLNSLATQAQYDQLQDDIALNVATGYLRVLMAREQVNIAQAQLELDKKQFEQTRSFVKAGKLPELNAVQLEAKLSGDSATVIGAETEARLALLQLQVLLNLNYNTPFDISAPSSEALAEQLSWNDLNSENIYTLATQRLNRMKYHQFAIASAEKNVGIAKASRYPSLSAFANLGTNYSSNVKDVIGQTYVGEESLGTISIGGTPYPVTRPSYEFDFKTRQLFTQYGNNLRVNAGLGLSVPLFNGLAARSSVQKAGLGLQRAQIQQESEQQRLRQDVVTAYEQARAARQKWVAMQHAENSALQALNYALKRYEVGLISTFDYTTTQNAYYTARVNALSALYDMVFKRKVLDYYMGIPIQLK
ncbi:MAG: TolC family protein [Chitinophagaceae bacterium]